MKDTNSRNALTLWSPLGDAATPRLVMGHETLSEPFSFVVTFTCKAAEVDLAAVLGQGMAVEIQGMGAAPRWIHGVVTRLGELQNGVRGTEYQARLNPWTWQLELRTRCRIFEHRSVAEVLDTLFAGQPVRNALTRRYAPRELCVQYRETDFDFASRLMQEEGISFFFEHTRDGHTLVLADDVAGFPPCPGPEAVTCGGPAGTAASRDGFTPHAVERDIAADEAGALVLTATARSTSPAFTAGHRFTLRGHPRHEASTGYVVRSLRVDADQDGYQAAIEAVDSGTYCRPPRLNARPVVAGAQAPVVAVRGERANGRSARVDFQWDAEEGESTACWMPVAPGVEPRVGRQAIVLFLEGDPERPLVIGCV